MCKKNVYGDLICFLFCYCFFQRPGTAEIKLRQGPGEQTGPGPGPGVMKWKMFTLQAPLQCTCTNRMRPALPSLPRPNCLSEFFLWFHSLLPNQYWIHEETNTSKVKHDRVGETKQIFNPNDPGTFPVFSESLAA